MTVQIIMATANTGR